ncbi:MAG: putative esterase YcpF (UPF0227 family) [Gammaproteobacteria bacterium]|jgi:predicted esterase YcpF (UPF0227 family)
MSGLLYIHGFLSSPKSYKAQLIGQWLQINRPQYQFLCPFLKPYPEQTQLALETIVENFQKSSSGQLYLMGSSLGGLWATWLSEKYNLKAVLINPVANLDLFQHKYINTTLKNDHTNDTYKLSENDVDGFKRVLVESISCPENYLLLVQTGDDVLDYRLAVTKYSRSKQIVEQGGDHSFINLESKLDLALEFLESSEK